jgi:hypothetical protein
MEGQISPRVREKLLHFVTLIIEIVHLDCRWGLYHGSADDELIVGGKINEKRMGLRVIEQDKHP